jgi:hypothetical protein
MYGHICFALTKNKWYDKCIAKFTNSKWSHCFFTCVPMLGKEMLMEADAHGVAVSSFDVGYRSNSNQSYELYEFKAPKKLKDLSIKSSIKELEISYGYLEYPWFVWRYMNRLFGRDIKKQNNWCQNGTKICSQFTREYIENCGKKDLFIEYGKGSVSPEDLYQIIISRPDLFRLIEKKD